MRDRELEILLDRVDRRPADPDAWVALIRAGARIGRPLDELAPRLPASALLGDLWQRLFQEPALAHALLPLFGLELAVEGRGSPGRFWEESGRAVDAGDHAFDRVTGFPLEVRRTKDDAPMVYVPAGRYLRMREVEGGREVPDRWVNLGAFLVDRFPVTVERYARFLAEVDGPEPREWRRQRARPGRPVVGVTWGQANTYAAWAGGKLLGDKAWEKAARGTTGRATPWVDGRPLPRSVPKPMADTAWDHELVEVGITPERTSAFGLEDPVGLVREWCRDVVDTYRAGTRSPGAGRRIRGTSFVDPGGRALLHPCARAPGAAFMDVGFRVGRPMTARVEADVTLPRRRAVQPGEMRIVSA